MMWEKVRTLVVSIKMEPVMLLYAMCFATIWGPTQELYLQKACKVNLNYSEVECDNIKSKNNSDIQTETQQLVAGIQVTLL